MARSQAVQIENSFIKGLITENTALNFPENACTETYNCVFDETGRVTRRTGIDVEENYIVGIQRNKTAGQAYTEYLWSNVAGTGVRSFIVQQQGSTLVFYDTSNDSTVTKNGEFQVLDISIYRPSGSVLLVQEYPCQYAQGDGRLIVVSKAIEPLVISFDTTTQTISASAVNLRYRDFLGLDYYNPTTYTLNYRPPFASIFDMKADSALDGAIHYYNLLNQGWWQGGADLDTTNSALGQWETARDDMPSNADRVSFFRASETDSFDNARVVSYSQGNTPAVKGHFILDIGQADRSAALASEGFNLSFSADEDTALGASFAAIIHNFDSNAFNNTNLAFDGSIAGSSYVAHNREVSGGFLAKASTTSASSTSPSATDTRDAFIGYNFSSTPRRIAAVTVRNSMLVAYRFNYSSGSYSSKTVNSTLSLSVYGSNTLPSSPTDGTLISDVVTRTASFNALSTGVNADLNLRDISIADSVIPINNTVNAYQYVWIRVTGVASAFGSISAATTTKVGAIPEITEVYFTIRETLSGSASLPSLDGTPNRPRCTAFFAGRAWYGGVDANNLSNNLYFSQIIERPEQYGMCYQANDPTSEAFFDILPTDGGVIKIPEMGRLIRMIPYQTSLLLFATNGVWIIRGGSGGFTATNFLVRKISSLGTQSPNSFVDVRGIPVWWGEDGILQIQYNPQFDTFSVEDISEESIRTFFLSIPSEKRNFVKGAYDVNESVIYWIYNDDINETDQYNYVDVLSYNVQSQAYYPWTYGESSAKIRGIIYSYDSVGSTPAVIKYPVSFSLTSSVTEQITFADNTRGTYSDWTVYATSVSGRPEDAVDFESYFITGYKIHAEVMKFFQPNYLMVMLEHEENSGAYLQAIFDFTNNQASGKWGSKQQLYNSSLLHRDIIYRRLKIRGKGRALQFKVTSESGKPFNIIGWSGFETANTEL